jgi:hypothetical protein
MNSQILLNDKRCTAVAGAKRRTFVAIVMMGMCRFSNFGVFVVLMKWFVNAWNCSEKQNING